MFNEAEQKDRKQLSYHELRQLRLSRSASEPVKKSKNKSKQALLDIVSDLQLDEDTLKRNQLRSSNPF